MEGLDPQKQAGYGSGFQQADGMGRLSKHTFLFVAGGLILLAVAAFGVYYFGFRQAAPEEVSVTSSTTQSGQPSAAGRSEARRAFESFAEASKMGDKSALSTLLSEKSRELFGDLTDVEILSQKYEYLSEFDEPGGVVINANTTNEVGYTKPEQFLMVYEAGSWKIGVVETFERGMRLQDEKRQAMQSFPRPENAYVDLVPSDIKVYPYPPTAGDAKMMVAVRIANRGNIPVESSGVTWGVLDDDKLHGVQGGLAGVILMPGEEQMWTFEPFGNTFRGSPDAVYNSEYLRPGPRKITVTVNDDRFIAESDYANNSVSRTIEFK